METIYATSSGDIQERLDALEDSGLVDGREFEVYRDHDFSEVIYDARIEKLKLEYVNVAYEDELRDLRDVSYCYKVADAAWRE